MPHESWAKINDEGDGNTNTSAPLCGANGDMGHDRSMGTKEQVYRLEFTISGVCVKYCQNA